MPPDGRLCAFPTGYAIVIIDTPPTVRMVSTAYARGRSREYEVLRLLRAEGWYCSRSAASHGPVDVFAARDGQVRMIQVKSGRARLRPGDRNTLKLWAEAYAGIAEVWYFGRRTGVVKETVFDARRKS